MSTTGIDWSVWLATMLPLIFSAGPGNIMVAASGARSGMRQSMSFIYGLDGTYFLLAVSVGLGLGQFFQMYPLVSSVIKSIGILYIFYLAYRFIVATAPTQNQILEPFRFRDGMVVQLTNTKGIIMLMVMFSEFFIPSADMISDIFLMSTVLVVLNFMAHLMWVTFGAAIQKVLVRNPSLFKTQNYLFSSMMLAVGFWLAAR